MGKTMEALCRLQVIEHDLSDVRRRLKRKSAAVDAQQARLEQARSEYESLQQEVLARQKAADAVDLQLREFEEKVSHLRGNLNTAKTNKEYAAILTQINTLKADNAKLEEQGLKLMGEVEAAREATAAAQQRITDAEAQLEQVRQTSAEEIARLEGIVADLEAKRREVAADAPADALAVFDRIAGTREGDAMAVIEIHGKKPPFDYVCGGCFMSLSAEHANALQTRDELRFCDNCGRILYLEESRQQA
jgi:predicted  nucleic acid-binding Zn-ribbon protein